MYPWRVFTELDWSQQHINWMVEQWANVLFTDESRSGFQNDSLRIHIWREPGTRFEPSNIVQRDQFGGGSIMVWAGIMMTTRKPLQGKPPRFNFCQISWRDFGTSCSVVMMLWTQTSYWWMIMLIFIHHSWSIFSWKLKVWLAYSLSRLRSDKSVCGML